MKVLKTSPRYLGNHIRFFYSVSSPASDNSKAIHRRLPDGTLDIVCNLGAPVLESRDGINFSAMPDMALVGLYRERVFLQYTGAVHLVGTVFQPGAAHLFVNDTLEQYKACTAPASLVFGGDIHVLREQLYDAPGEGEKHELLERYLLNYLRKRTRAQASPQIIEAIRQIHAQDGDTEITALYKSNFITERTFRRKFTECVGMSPKQYSLIVKIKSFSKRYELSKATCTDICHDLGYTDQSHFSKDFHKIVGTAPTSYFNQLNELGAEFIHLI